MESTYYYVTMRRDSRTAFLLGPCRQHETALALVETVRKAAEEVDPFTAFDAFGTASVIWNHKLPLLPDGKLNNRLGFDTGTDRIEEQPMAD